MAMFLGADTSKYDSVSLSVTERRSAGAGSDEAFIVSYLQKLVEQIRRTD